MKCMYQNDSCVDCPDKNECHNIQGSQQINHTEES